MEPIPAAVEVRTAREFPTADFLNVLMAPVGQYALPFLFTERNRLKEIQVNRHGDVSSQVEAEQGPEDRSFLLLF